MMRQLPTWDSAYRDARAAYASQYAAAPSDARLVQWTHAWLKAMWRVQLEDCTTDELLAFPQALRKAARAWRAGKQAEVRG